MIKFIPDKIINFFGNLTSRSMSRGHKSRKFNKKAIVRFRVKLTQISIHRKEQDLDLHFPPQKFIKKNKKQIKQIKNRANSKILHSSRSQ